MFYQLFANLPATRPDLLIHMEDARDVTHRLHFAGGNSRKSEACYAEKTRYKRCSVYQHERRTVVEEVNGSTSEEAGAEAGLESDGRDRKCFESAGQCCTANEVNW